MWVNLIKADEPSLNNNVYPEKVLEEASRLSPVSVYQVYGRATKDGSFRHAGPPIAQVLEYRYDMGWLQARLHFMCPHFASLIRDGRQVVRAAVAGLTTDLNSDGSSARIVLGIDRIDHLALCDLFEASWCIDNACENSLIPSR